ncbi:hypothetical protein ACH5F7_001762 [Campylobacter coli]
MGEVYQTEIANKKEVVSSQETSEEGKEKPFNLYKQKVKAKLTKMIIK